MTWSIVTTGPYMNMLEYVSSAFLCDTTPTNTLYFIQGMFGPLHQRKDGTFVFATPIGSGHVPMIALSDLGYFARFTFDHREDTSGKELEIATEMVGWDSLVSTFKKVTGQKAIVLHQSLDEWFANFENVDLPLAHDYNKGVEVEGVVTFRSNFTAWWSAFRDDKLTRDMEWIRKNNPKGHTLESWMRESNYKGQLKSDLLKNAEDGKSVVPNWARVSKL